MKTDSKTFFFIYCNLNKWSFYFNKITVLDPQSADDCNNFLAMKNLKIPSKIFLSIDVKETLFE